MPVIISFIVLVGVTYYLLATASSSVASFIPWSSGLRELVGSNALVAHGIATVVSLIGFFTAGISVLFVRGKTLVVGGKKTLIVFTALFLISTVLLMIRILALLSPLLSSLAGSGQ